MLWSFIDPKLANEVNANDLMYYHKYKMGYFKGIYGRIGIGSLYGKDWKVISTYIIYIFINLINILLFIVIKIYMGPPLQLLKIL